MIVLKWRLKRQTHLFLLRLKLIELVFNRLHLAEEGVIAIVKRWGLLVRREFLSQSFRVLNQFCRVWRLVRVHLRRDRLNLFRDPLDSPVFPALLRADQDPRHRSNPVLTHLADVLGLNFLFNSFVQPVRAWNYLVLNHSGRLKRCRFRVELLS